MPLLAGSLLGRTKAPTVLPGKFHIFVVSEAEGFTQYAVKLLPEISTPCGPAEDGPTLADRCATTLNDQIAELDDTQPVILLDRELFPRNIDGQFAELKSLRDQLGDAGRFIILCTQDLGIDRWPAHEAGARIVLPARFTAAHLVTEVNAGIRNDREQLAVLRRRLARERAAKRRIRRAWMWFAGAFAGAVGALFVAVLPIYVRDFLHNLGEDWQVGVVLKHAAETNVECDLYVANREWTARNHVVVQKLPKTVTIEGLGEGQPLDSIGPHRVLRVPFTIVGRNEIVQVCPQEIVVESHDFWGTPIRRPYDLSDLLNRIASDPP
jgi:hypothetical protein